MAIPDPDPMIQSSVDSLTMRGALAEILTASVPVEIPEEFLVGFRCRYQDGFKWSTAARATPCNGNPSLLLRDEQFA